MEELSSAVILKVDAPVIPSFMANYTAAPEGLSPGVKAKRSIKFLLISISLGAIFAFGYFLITKVILKPKNVQPVIPPSVVQKNDVVVVPSDAPRVQGELTKQLDEANKVKRVSAQIYYDISIADAKAAPTELALGTTYIAVCDATQGKIFVSTKAIAKFQELPQLFPGVKNLLFEGDTLIFTDNEGVKFYNLATKSVTKSYLADTKYPTIGPSSEYLGFTYAVSGDKLVKFSKIGNKLSGTLWLQKPEFSNASSIDIDGSIYVLFSTGNLEKYTAGVKDDFSIVGLDKPIQKPLKVVTNSDYRQIYVGDGAEGRILAFDTDGILAFQIKPQLGSEWLELKSFDISTDEKSFYVLSGTKVFEFAL